VNPVFKHRLAGLGPLGRGALLALWMAIALVLALPLAVYGGGAAACVAAVAAASAVFAASLAALLVGDVFSHAAEAYVGVLLGTLVRMSFSVAACVIVAFSGGPLLHAGFIYFVLGFYLAALPVDVLLAVSKIESSPGPSSGRL
jgi:hypothetical protein